ncbi:MAG: acyl-CoA reductase [Bacteroidales bacterium]
MNNSLKQRLNAFIKLGDNIQTVLHSNDPKNLSESQKTLWKQIKESAIYNPWFTEENVVAALQGIAQMLEKEKIEQWISDYPQNYFQPTKPKTVAVIMAGNIPLVGFHDMLCVLISGNILLGKLSGQDNHLPVILTEMLIEIEPDFSDFIIMTSETISGFDAVIATGSNNTSRYFEYYFGKYPHIIRKNRSSIAVLNGNETNEALALLAHDVFQYFGLGCRNVSKIFVPKDFNISKLAENWQQYEKLNRHSKYMNNYDYQKAIMLVNKIPHLDTGFALLTENPSLSSPLSVIHYEYYDNMSLLQKQIKQLKDQLQCISTTMQNLTQEVPLVEHGKTQIPGPSDYADGVDTLNFLFSLQGS